MYPTKPESTSTLHLSNGHLSPPPNIFTSTGAVTSGSESDLSEVIDPPNATSSSSPDRKQESLGNGYHSKRSSVSSHEEDAVGSEDAEYDMGTPSSHDEGAHRDARSSSQDSRRPAKRKAGIEDDIMNNPELYGLRRSVSCSEIGVIFQLLRYVYRVVPASLGE